MYRDLKDNEDLIVAHPIVGALALGPESGEGLAFEPPSETRMDDAAPPEDMTSILDADVDQRACIVAACSGNSFVMDGPPGSGE